MLDLQEMRSTMKGRAWLLRTSGGGGGGGAAAAGAFLALLLARRVHAVWEAPG